MSTHQKPAQRSNYQRPEQKQRDSGRGHYHQRQEEPTEITMMEICKQGMSDTAMSGGIHELNLGLKSFLTGCQEQKLVLLYKREEDRREGGTSSGVRQNFLAIELAALLGSRLSIMRSVQNRHLSLSNLGFHCPHPTTLILSEILTLTFQGNPRELQIPHTTTEL